MSYPRALYGAHRYGRKRHRRWAHLAQMTQTLHRCVQLTAAREIDAAPIDFMAIDETLAQLSVQLDALAEQVHVRVIQDALRRRRDADRLRAWRADTRDQKTA